MFTYPCPNCAMRLNAPEERAGQRTMCPKCLRPILIPSPEVIALLRGEDDVDLQPPEPEDAPGPATPAERSVLGHGVLSAPRNSADSGRIVFSTAMMSPMDMAADLSTAISLRMKPPPDPPADLRLSTGVWLILTLGGIALWLIGISVEPDVLPLVLVAGAFQAALGYLWAAYLVGKRSRVWGLLTLLPPIGLVRLFLPFGENGFRPLRFVVSGLLVVAIWTIAPQVREEIKTWPWLARMTSPPKADALPPASGAAEKLKAAAERRQPEYLVGQLADLSRPEAVAETPEADRPAVVAEIAAVLKSDQPEVRTAALNALAVWAPADARGPTLAALKSADPGERRSAMALAVRWPDAEMATAVATRLTDRQEQNTAQEILLAMGGPAAEAALLPLLRSDDQLFVLFVLDLVEKIGGPKSVDGLRDLSLTGTNSTIRKEAGKAADALAARINGKK